MKNDIFDDPSRSFLRRHPRRALLRGIVAALAVSLPASAWATDQEGNQEAIAAFHKAAETGDVAALRNLIATHPTLINKRTPGGITPLGRAVIHGQIEAVRALLVGKADPNLAKPDGAAPLHDAASQKNVALIRLLLEYKADTEVRWKDGSTPLVIAVSVGDEDGVRLLIEKGAKRDARTDDGRTPFFVAVLRLVDEAATATAPKGGAVALLETIPAALDVAATPLADVFKILFASVPGVKVGSVIVDDALTMAITVKLKGSLDTALSFLVKMARRQGQPVSLSLTAGVLRIAPSSMPAPIGITTTNTIIGSVEALPSRREEWPVLTTDLRYRFTRSISLAVLNAYLSRAVTHFGLLSSSPEPATAFFDDDLRMLTNIGAKFIGRCAYAWEPPDDDESHFRLAAERAARAHTADPSFLLQAAIFETAYRKVEQIAVPEWAFSEFNLPVEKRNFRYEAMLYDKGELHDHWMQNASVPDMSQTETKLWFYYRARRYLDAGCEAIHFGQVELMDHRDPDHRHWADLLRRIRRYAATYARRRFVLCDAHTHGIVVEGGQLLFDFHSFPLITKDIPNRPRKVELVDHWYNVVYGRSRGGKSPSGWNCARLPYLAEVDNGGTSDKPWESVGFPWVWGVDSISWFAHLSPTERNDFLVYARNWLQARNEDAWFQPPTRRVLAAPVDGKTMYHANRKSAACPVGFDQEDTLKALFTIR